MTIFWFFEKCFTELKHKNCVSEILTYKVLISPKFFDKKI